MLLGVQISQLLRVLPIWTSNGSLGPTRCDGPDMGISRSRHLGCQVAEPNFRKAARGEVGKYKPG